MLPISKYQNNPSITDYYVWCSMCVQYFFFTAPDLKDGSICYCHICDSGVRYANIEKHLKTSKHLRMDRSERPKRSKLDAF